MSPETMTRDEVSCLLYLETVCVDYSGLAQSVRMNKDDHEAIARFREAGLLEFGRVPARLLRRDETYPRDYWVTLTDAGWTLAHQLRRARAAKLSKRRLEIDALVAERRAQL